MTTHRREAGLLDGQKLDYFGTKLDYFGTKLDYIGAKLDYIGTKLSYIGILWDILFIVIFKIRTVWSIDMQKLIV